MSDLHTVPPSTISNELINAIDDAKDDLAAEHGMEVCAKCLAELTRS